MLLNELSLAATRPEFSFEGERKRARIYATQGLDYNALSFSPFLSTESVLLTMELINLIYMNFRVIRGNWKSRAGEI